MKDTTIQWCHSTVNPVMGCDSCELWKPAPAVRLSIQNFLVGLTHLPGHKLAPVIRVVAGDRETSEVYRDRELIAQEIAEKMGLDGLAREEIVDVIRRECKCYAGLLGTFRAGQKGYADAFAAPKLFPRRMIKAANWASPTPTEIEDRPWLGGLPRLIFVSDMGDALSAGVSFEYLLAEIIENVLSPAGQRHVWLWLTKRPGRMAEFGGWLLERGVQWPENLVAMTTVTKQTYASRVDQLRRVQAKLRGLSVEPLFERVKLNLKDIDWVIVGGGSDILAEPFHLEWAFDLQRQCEAAGVAFFLKQLGHRPFFRAEPVALADRHGGDWSEWPKEWRTREFPEAFRACEMLTL